jgi:phosphoglycolate phosphatase
LGVSYGAHDPSALMDLKPHYVAHSVQQLQAWLLANA